MARRRRLGAGGLGAKISAARRRLKTIVPSAVIAAGAAIPSCALAQHTEQNATTQSSDAFGRSVGNERSGLYSSSEVRGFNPSEAGNIRLQGLYFDLVNLLSARLIEGLTVRVGIAAQRYPFPAPTGLVDYELAVPHDEASLSIETDTAGPQVRGPSIVANVKLPLDGERLGFAGGVTARQANRHEGGHHHFRTYAGLLAFRPSPGTEILAFTSQLYTLSQDARATYFPAGTEPPPHVQRGKYLGLDWTQYDVRAATHGAIARVPLGDGLRVDAGLFLSRQSVEPAFADFLFGVTPDGATTNRLVIAGAGNTDKSLSGEFRLIREWSAGPLTHRIMASVRGRRRDKEFGGSRQLSLGPGPGTIFTAEGWTKPGYTPGPRNEDRVRQITAGLSYSLLWQGTASLDVALAKSRYAKTIHFADPALAEAVTRDRPLLWNVSGSFALSGNLYLFGGISRGQEDALAAPDNAINNAEAPPAVRTRQVEAGLRIGIAPNLSAVVGVFSISKPYFNLDPGRRYRQLGKVTNRGIELSLTGRLAPGLTVVGGALLLDPRISGEAVDSGLIGKRPIGQVQRRVVANVDWRTHGGTGALSFDLAIEAFSSRIGNAANTLRAPPQSTVNLGGRYRFSLGDKKFVVRPLITNLFDDYGWNVAPSGGFTYTNRRTALLLLIADL